MDSDTWKLEIIIINIVRLSLPLAAVAIIVSIVITIAEVSLSLPLAVVSVLVAQSYPWPQS